MVSLSPGAPSGTLFGSEAKGRGSTGGSEPGTATSFARWLAWTGSVRQHSRWQPAHGDVEELQYGQPSAAEVVLAGSNFSASGMKWSKTTCNPRRARPRTDNTAETPDESLRRAASPVLSTLPDDLQRVGQCSDVVAAIRCLRNEDPRLKKTYAQSVRSPCVSRRGGQAHSRTLPRGASHGDAEASRSPTWQGLRNPDHPGLVESLACLIEEIAALPIRCCRIR